MTSGSYEGSDSLDIDDDILIVNQFTVLYLDLARI